MMSIERMVRYLRLLRRRPAGKIGAERRTMLLVLPLFVFWGQAGCAARPAVGPEPSLSSATRGMERVYTAAYSSLEDSRRLVIRERREWETVWKEVTGHLSPAPALPDVDFTRDMLILAAMGTRSTGGFSIEVLSAEVREGRLVVTVREVAPGAGCMLTQALTSPVAIVRVPRSDAPATFVERRETAGCDEE